MDVKIQQRLYSSFGCRFLSMWFMLSNIALVYSSQDSNCSKPFYHIGEDAKLNCSVGSKEETIKLPYCRNDSSFQYKPERGQQGKHSVDFENDTKTVIFTIANITEEDFTKYECGVLFPENAAVTWICCFNLTQSPNNPSPAPSITMNINKSATFISQEDVDTSILTIQPNLEDFNYTSTSCDTEIRVKNEKKYMAICMKKEMLSYERFDIVTNNCLDYLITNNGNKAVNVIILYKGENCNVTCYRSDRICNVSSPNGSSSSSPTTTGQRRSLSEATGQTTTVKSNSHNDNEQKESDKKVLTVIYVLCGVMIVLVLLIAALCFYLCCSGKKISKTQATPIYSHTLGVVKIEFQSQNSSTSNSNRGEYEERVTNRNHEEKDSNSQNLVSEASGWEDNIAYEACVNGNEGDYADMNDKHLLNENESNLSVIDKESKETTCNSNSNLYESVINKRE